MMAPKRNFCDVQRGILNVEAEAAKFVANDSAPFTKRQALRRACNLFENFGETLE